MGKRQKRTLLKLLLGQSLLLVSFSVFSVVLFYLLEKDYDANSIILGTFGMITAIPPSLIAIGAPMLDNISHIKLKLIVLQIVSSIGILLGGLSLLIHFSLVVVGLFYFIISVTTTVSGSIEVSFIPMIFDQDEDKIEHSVDLQYFLGSGITVLIGILASISLLKVGSLNLLLISFVSTPLGILCYINIHHSENQVGLDGDESIDLSYFKKMIKELHQFVTTMPAFIIILFEAILGGLSGLLMDLMPLTMKELGVPIALFALVSSVQKAGDFMGGFLAPLVKMKASSFFILDYLVSGFCIYLISFNLPNTVRLLLLLVAGVVMGMSGNVFEKLMYRSYNVGDVSSMHALTTSTFSLFSVIGLFAAWIKVDTLELWQITGIVTIVFAVLLVLIMKKISQKDI